MLTASYHIIAIQARILLVIGLAWLAWGLYAGYDPLQVAWRAAAGALVAMLASGALLRLAARIITQRMEQLEAQEEAPAAETAGAASA